MKKFIITIIALLYSFLYANILFAASETNLYGAFTNAGIWKWDGSAWSQVTPSNPEALAAIGTILYGDFGSSGIWKWDGSAWSQTTPSNPQMMAVSDLTLYGAFTGAGIWKYDGSTWSQVTFSNPEAIAATGSNLYGDFGSAGIWKWDGTSWSQVTPNNPQMITASVSNLYGAFAGGGIWKWDGSSWNQVTPSNPEAIVAYGSTLYGDFGSSGIWRWEGSTWSQVTPNNPQLITASGSTLYGAFAGGGIWKWDGSSWTQLTPNEPASMVPCTVPTQIIADHTVVEKYNLIPQRFIDEIKKMWINIPGESHSSGYRKGLQFLEDLDSRFQVNITESGTPEAYTDQYLRISRASWGDVSHATGWRYGYGEEDWYTSATAIQQTKDHLRYANTNGFEITAMGFGWCWDTTWHPSGWISIANELDPVYNVHWDGSSSGGPDGNTRWGLDAGDVALTGNSITMDTYLNATQEYMNYAQTNGYPTQVFFTTGPVDGSSGENGYQRHLKHEYIRAYVLTSSDRVLFDYADILSWSNAGQQNLQTWTDYGGTPRQYQMIHADNMLDLDGTYIEDGDHIGQRGALRLGKAMWWMLARMAGWDGVSP